MYPQSNGPFFCDKGKFKQLNMASHTNTYTDQYGLGRGHMWSAQGRALSPDVGTLEYLYVA